MLNINKKVENKSVSIALEGRLDTTTAPDLEKMLESILDGITELTLDFSNLEYISSTGLRVLLNAQKVMDLQGSMKVSHVNEKIMEIFDVTRFIDILTIE